MMIVMGIKTAASIIEKVSVWTEIMKNELKNRAPRARLRSGRIVVMRKLPFEDPVCGALARKRIETRARKNRQSPEVSRFADNNKTRKAIHFVCHYEYETLRATIGF